ncbi:MAG: hypothetical protein JSS81_18500 [Acidobacteria bacterium]|nr:hypothetical protein [Acidobacteriota bacterium]
MVKGKRKIADWSAGILARHAAPAVSNRSESSTPLDDEKLVRALALRPARMPALQSRGFRFDFQLEGYRTNCRQILFNGNDFGLRIADFGFRIGPV